jgi:hypothetical protein
MPKSTAGLGFEPRGRLHAQRFRRPLRHDLLTPLLKGVRQYMRQPVLADTSAPLAPSHSGGVSALRAKAREPHPPPAEIVRAADADELAHERAVGDDVKLLILNALDDPPDGLSQLRGVLMNEHQWRQREGPRSMSRSCAAGT